VIDKGRGVDPEKGATVELSDLTAAIETGDRTRAIEFTRQAIDQRLDPQTILDSMTAAMQAVGERFQRNEVYVPEMLIAARAMKEVMALLEPVLVDAGVKPIATAVIGTVAGDLHDIGKNLVGMMWRGANIEVFDLGTNVPAERFVASAQEHAAKIVGVSALLTTTMVGMRDVVAAVRASGLTETRVFVGGAPVTTEFAHEIGADGYAPDAATAVDVVRGFIAPRARVLGTE
jgi:5-methyltetrahydrofolate--homocysteine methyltransferase